MNRTNNVQIVKAVGKEYQRGEPQIQTFHDFTLSMNNHVARFTTGSFGSGSSMKNLTRNAAPFRCRQA
jgi:hypothetical protein